MLYESAKFHGPWWLPDQPQRRLAGTLDLKPERFSLAQRLVECWEQLTATGRQTLQGCGEVLASDEADLKQQVSGLVWLTTETLRSRRFQRGGTADGAVEIRRQED